MRKKHKITHTMSRKGYARLEHEMKEESLDLSSITRVDVWIQGHKNKDGKHLNEATSSTLKSIEEMKSSDNQDNLRQDTLAKNFGPERRGQVRALGFGVTPSQ
ncbi:hypothetical protein Ddye_028028 [Dipteronia dyeriana]|uniref:Uncharacterized protein n=1 Tax=Dipteronia dyeriana TaxID=168575 RepID=A0AAD9WS00_9ROSI|nr:hypothetical protein Ddye_028028 [Dipteronia dyeriana]